MRDASFGGALYELRRAVKNCVKSEGILAQTELKASAASLGQGVIRAGISGIFVFFSSLSFLAFLIIGLGELFGQRFWLSALIWSFVFGTVGGVLGYQALRRSQQIKHFTLPRSREFFSPSRFSSQNLTKHESEKRNAS